MLFALRAIALNVENTPRVTSADGYSTTALDPNTKQASSIPGGIQGRVARQVLLGLVRAKVVAAEARDPAVLALVELGAHVLLAVVPPARRSREECIRACACARGKATPV